MIENSYSTLRVDLAKSQSLSDSSNEVISFFIEFFLLLSSLSTFLCLLNLAMSGGDTGTQFFNMLNTNSLTVLICSPLAC